jgi:transposase
MRTPGSAEQLEARRMLAAQLLHKSMGVSEVARLLGVSKGSVSDWKERLTTGGVEALKAKPHPGRKPWLSKRQKEQLVKLLLRGARKAGYPNDLWTCPRVAAMIHRRFGVEYHPDYMGMLLRKLGWSWQKPEHRARERDPAAIAHWREHEWPRIKKGTKKSS